MPDEVLHRVKVSPNCDCTLFIASELESHGVSWQWQDFTVVDRPEAADILILATTTPCPLGKGALQRLRPVVWVGPRDAPAEFRLPNLRPGIVRPVLEKAAGIVVQIKELRTAVDDSRLIEVPNALLAFAWTRERRIAARLSSSFPRGFGYDAEHMLAASSDGDYSDLLPHLMALSEAGYLTAEFHDLAHTCPSCGSINLLLRDGCPSCGAVDMIDETLLHHFACGLQAEESRFVTHGSDYVCPKCRRELRHFGLDYDKPGVLHLCNACGQRATELEARGRCLNCDARFSADESARLNIYDFVLTPAGADALLSGTVQVDAVAGLIGRNLALVPFEFATMMANKMAAIQTRHGLSSAVIIIDLTRLTSLPRGTGMQTAFYVRIGLELSALLRSTDAVAYHLGRLVLVLPGTDKEHADLVRSRLCKALSAVFEEPVIAGLSFEHVTVEDFLKRPRLTET